MTHQVRGEHASPTAPGSTTADHDPAAFREQRPAAQGLYDPSQEHDACGVAFVAQLSGEPSHDIVEKGLEALRNLDHRGATGADTAAGDGAGILVVVPDAFLRGVCDFELPAQGRYAVGMAYLPREQDARSRARRAVEALADDEGLTVLGWREVPADASTLSPVSTANMPHFEHLVVAAADGSEGMALERMAFCLRRRAQNQVGVYFASLSCRTLVYKGMLTTDQLEEVFPELHDERLASPLALVHSRFSTNTFPAWELAHPYRLIAHNGEINTVRGNRNWMRAREELLASDLIPGDLSRLYPICSDSASDSASFDEVLELLHLGGRSLPHAVLMMVPEAWENSTEMNQELKDFYAFHSSLMEPWDGPAAICFTDGTRIGAWLDRNGLRPGRYWVTDDGLVVLASETGVLDIPASSVTAKGRLKPGRMFLVDLEQHRIIGDEEIKTELATAEPYGEWLKGRVSLNDLPTREHTVHSHASVTRRQQVFGYTEEDLRLLISPMASMGAEPIGSMGTDTPLAVLSQRPRLIFDYFSQLFAQVTNPPLDAIREELVTSLAGTLGPERNLLAPEPASCRQLVVPFPVLDNDQLAKILHVHRSDDLPGFATSVVRGLYPVGGGGAALEQAIAEACAEASRAIAAGARIILLSDRHSNAELAPIPSLLLTAAVHHHLVREKTRTKVGLVVEAGDVREVHHVALLLGYGAAAVNPYLAFETAEDLARREVYVAVEAEKAVANVAKALGKGVLKVMSKMGVSTVASYTGAQIFEAYGLSAQLVDRYFTGTTSKMGGVGLEEVAEEIRRRHATAYPADGIPLAHRELEIGGEYQWRREGEPHLFDPESVFRLQHSTRSGRYDVFKQYTARVDDNAARQMTLRSLLRFASDRSPVPIEEVEPVSAIVKRFSTGAMSYGSISQEAHETLAIAMNRLGGKSNTGEGGEDTDRLHDPVRRSAIKQVASGRFGVTSDYLTNASDIQIKMAQGAKPGEGGQLPGQKVYPWVARTRHSTPGVGLISPPPHHDIYSIEDLKQLIHDLKCANPVARVHVKLVAEVGVGTVAAGVAKAKADVVLISGHDGGTGAAPLTSLKHAGGPWELGLAEAQQTLLLNGLRDRIVVQCDGQLKTGRDVVVAALLGAEEFGFATAPLVVSGCVMMRVCHLDTCPVGVATQNPDLRARYTGKAEYLVNFFEFIAEEVREHLAALGFRSVEEAVGHVEALDGTGAVEHWKAHGLDISPILHQPTLPEGTPLHRVNVQDHGLEHKLDQRLIEFAGPVLEAARTGDLPAPLRGEFAVRNVDRTVGTLLGHEVTKATGGKGLEPDTIELVLDGSAGQSLGAFLPRGITLRLTGDSNDYVGKGLSGGRIIIAPETGAAFLEDHSETGGAEEQIVAGNVIGYGATSGEIFIRGQVGERFCVRNSGATAVVEGVGDHGCEYMTGGVAVVLGSTGRNFAAGMSGGVAYVLDMRHDRLNSELVDPLPLDADDVALVRELLQRHRDETGSSTAAQLLGDASGSSVAERFTKVMPRDYAKVVAARIAAEADGLDEQTTTRKMMEAAHG
ncbi:glutamate synthase large subunit [Auraticoccus monumenti]|uniref:Glutamate synthase (NADH) large subunit n=1 Tax=Auraticoccus monumenti TaxID=675864 RepID=A0A1G7B4V1_9ACTN|nr:glutamate synthase large subunit [Auraticoccus monumenti]SDE22144.1 glutamate synthase (NADH) large subunit [Auraticoccus monumenti]